MARREVCFLIGENQTILWSDASGSETKLFDSRERWERIWELRDVLVEIAHSHPTGGAFFSAEDESTMRALSSALPRPLRFSVVAPEAMIAREDSRDCIVEPEPWWASLLRVSSGMDETRVSPKQEKKEV